MATALIGAGASIIGGALSGKSKSTSSSSFLPPRPFNFTTGSGSQFAGGPAGGFSVLSPQIGFFRNTAFNQGQGLRNDVSGDISRLRSLENPFIQARVRPTEENFARRRSDISRGLERRGVQGTLANNELMRFDDAAARTVADERALALSDSLGAILQRQGVIGGIVNSVAGLQQTELQQALAELGINLSGFNSITDSQRQTGSTQTNVNPTQGLSNIANLGFGISGLFGKGGGTFGSGAGSGSGFGVSSVPNNSFRLG